jgi:TATA-binding protein-associated factor Taf7
MPYSQIAFGRTVNKKCLVSETCTLLENRPNCCEVRKADDDDEEDDDDDDDDDNEEDDDDDDDQESSSLTGLLDIAVPHPSQSQLTFHNY